MMMIIVVIISLMIPIIITIIIMILGRGNGAVGNPHRARIYQLELFEQVLSSKVDKQFPVEQFETHPKRSCMLIHSGCRKVSSSGEPHRGVYIYIYVYIYICIYIYTYIYVHIHVFSYVTLQPQAPAPRGGGSFVFVCLGQ